jgi:hypothetical protein
MKWAAAYVARLPVYAVALILVPRAVSPLWLEIAVALIDRRLELRPRA